MLGPSIFRYVYGFCKLCIYLISYSILFRLEILLIYRNLSVRASRSVVPLDLTFSRSLY